MTFGDYLVPLLQHLGLRGVASGTSAEAAKAPLQPFASSAQVLMGQSKMGIVTLSKSSRSLDHLIPSITHRQ